MPYFQFCLNSLLLLFWVRLWTRPQREFYFNPFISSLVRWSDQPINFLRVALPLSERLVAFLIFAILFVLKTLILLRAGFHPELVIGRFFIFKPLASAGGIPSPAAFFLFSGMETIFFFLRLWAVFLLIQLITPKERISRAFEAFSFLSRPFSQLFVLLQLVVLGAVVLGAVVFLLNYAALSPFGAPSDPDAPAQLTASLFTGGPLFIRALRTIWLAFLAMADGLNLINQALFVSILGNIACTIFKWRPGILFCDECMALLMGRFARRVQIGMGFDITPIIFFVVVNLVYALSRSLIIGLIRMPLSAFGLF